MKLIVHLIVLCTSLYVWWEEPFGPDIAWWTGFGLIVYAALIVVIIILAAVCTASETPAQRAFRELARRQGIKLLLPVMCLGLTATAAEAQTERCSYVSDVYGYGEYCHATPHDAVKRWADGVCLGSHGRVWLGIPKGYGPAKHFYGTSDYSSIWNRYTVELHSSGQGDREFETLIELCSVVQNIAKHWQSIGELQ